MTMWLDTFFNINRHFHWPLIFFNHIHVSIISFTYYMWWSLHIINVYIHLHTTIVMKLTQKKINDWSITCHYVNVFYFIISYIHDLFLTSLKFCNFFFLMRLDFIKLYCKSLYMQHTFLAHSFALICLMEVLKKFI